MRTQKSTRTSPPPLTAGDGNDNTLPLFDMTPMQERAEEASQLLKSLANVHRLRIMCLLVAGEMTVGQINESLIDLSQSALSQHLARLREQNLVSTRREAQTIWYTLAAGPSRQIMLALRDIYCPVAD